MRVTIILMVQAARNVEYAERLWGEVQGTFAVLWISFLRPHIATRCSSSRCKSGSSVRSGNADAELEEGGTAFLEAMQAAERNHNVMARRLDDAWKELRRAQQEIDRLEALLTEVPTPTESPHSTQCASANSGCNQDVAMLAEAGESPACQGAAQPAYSVNATAPDIEVDNAESIVMAVPVSLASNCSYDSMVDLMLESQY